MSKKNEKAEKELKEEQQEEIEPEVQEESTEKKDSKNGKSDKSKSKLEDKINELEKEKNDLKDMMLRKAAEFENYKRRTEKEQEAIIKYASERFVMSILPVYNDLERSISHIDDEYNAESLKKGLKLVFQNLKKAFDDNDVVKMDPKGKEFDFNLHEALMQQPSKDVPPHTVLEVIEPGFIYKDKVIKHAKVIVSQEVIEPVADEQEETKTKNEE